MSFRVTSRAWAVKGLSPSERLVLVRLADMANDEGVTWPLWRTIANDCELSLRSVRRIAATLEAKGLLHRRAQYRANGSQRGNLFVVLPPDDRRAAEVLDDVPEGVGGGDTDDTPPMGGSVTDDTPPLSRVTPLGVSRMTPLEPSLNHLSEPCARVDVSGLSTFVRDRLLARQSVTVGGHLVQPFSPEAERLIALMRAEDA